MCNQLGTASAASNHVFVMCSGLRYRRSKLLGVQQMIAEVRVELAKRTSEDDGGSPRVWFHEGWSKKLPGVV